jgi:tetratricopeptide (TPR) repeat protein
LDAAEVVCADATLQTTDVLKLLDQLVQKSLAVRDEQKDRYGFLETIHDYAESRLREAGEIDTLRARHRRYFLGLAEAAEPSFQKRTNELPWLRALEREHANLSAALQWSLEQSGFTVDALRMCGALGRYWRIRGHWREGRDLCSAALEKDAGAAAEDVRAKALITAGMMNFWLGETIAAEALVETALALAREAGNRSLEAVALNNLSNLVSDHGDFARAHRLLNDAVAINHELGNQEWECINLNNIGELFSEQGDLAAAQGPLESALALGREIRSESLKAIALSSMGRLAERLGDYQQARILFEEALALFRGLAYLAEEVQQTLGLARICIACSEPAPAARHLAEALHTSRKLGHRSIVRCLDVMIGLAADVAACEKAAIFRGACQGLRKMTGVLPTPWEAEQAEQHCSACRAAVGSAAFAAGEATGRALSTEAIIATGLEWLASIGPAKPSSSPDPGGDASEGSGPQGFV